ncbi:MAG: C-terminal binding protein [Rhodospirillaceae bacterium]|jgi:D-3-phosphoglycerate dehydrogenase / 2-oxoglutarate reductase|nr:C-terminal binding protein [Rhodospirillaceae bacterium]MBT5940915.1 C-terminal binding protein [Rhodospirillaceae bacterium]MBT7265711.1 C-terminal binding protein [Rhodospirillaceae bacterium]
MSSNIIAVADSVFPSLDPAKEALSGVTSEEFRMSADTSADSILAVAADADALLVTYSQINAEVIAGLNNCKAIGRFGIGTDNIDIAAATEKGIKVCYAPVYCLDEVSDHAMALLLSCARKIPFANARAAEGRWEMPAVAPIGRFRGRTLGLIGLGNIPQQIVGKAQAFGINVIASDPYCPDDVFSRLNVEKVELDDLLGRSDYVSVHAPLTPETENMFNMDAFKKMKNTAFLINTARGPLVEINDLAKALDAGEIAGAGLDVLPVEPPEADNPLLGRDDVVLTPHTGFYSEDALLDLQTTVATDVATILGGGEPKYPVTPK